MDDVVGRSQVQARAARFQRDEEDGDLGRVVEFVDLLEAILGRAVQVAEGDLNHVQPVADDMQHLHELREHEHLVPVVDDGGDQILEGLELAGRQVGVEAGHVEL